jgi:hypothetical protein
MKVSRLSIVFAALAALALSDVAMAQGGPPPVRPGEAPAAGAQGNRGGGAGGGNRGGGGGGGNRGGGGGGAAAAPVAPAPRSADGSHPLLSTYGKGLWHGGFTMTGTDIPYQDWARGVAQVRQSEKLEPHARCKPSGALRQFQTPYGVDILEMPEQKVIYIMDVGGPHTYRTIYMDGRAHPTGAELDKVRSFYGHSTGKWVGDTLEIDTVGYNDKFWIDRGDSANTGFVHTPQLHTIEKLTRTNMNTIRYELTIDDPAAYTKVWSANPYTVTLQAQEELFEYICQDNNQGATLMVGTGESVDRSSVIVP